MTRLLSASSARLKHSLMQQVRIFYVQHEQLVLENFRILNYGWCSGLRLQRNVAHNLNRIIQVFLFLEADIYDAHQIRRHNNHLKLLNASTDNFKLTPKENNAHGWTKENIFFHRFLWCYLGLLQIEFRWNNDVNFLNSFQFYDFKTLIEKEV